MFILFPYALRYSFLSLCRLHLQSFFQYVNTCIRIPVMNRVTFWALPDTNAQIFHQRIPAATKAAGLAARIHRWYSAYFISIPNRLIFQHFKKTLPRKHSLWILPVYGSGSFLSHSNLRCRWFGFRAPASLTASAGNRFFDSLLSHVLWLL